MIIDEIRKKSKSRMRIFCEIQTWINETSQSENTEMLTSEYYVKLSDIEKILGEYEKKQIKIFRWLLGYGHFPPRKDGEGAYWWRSNLRVLLNQIGITKEKLEQFEVKE